MGLHEIETFDFTLQSTVTIILGGNGCGKTSLLSVFLPLAPSKTEFRDGGSYTNYALVGDQRFKFHVKRKGSSLVCDIENLTTGEKLIDNANSKVYNSRIEELTGITKEIKELINGEMLLTDAGTDLRRKWLNKMSSSDLTYALGFYARLRKNLTGLNGAMDHTSRKIAELKMRVVEDNDERKQLGERLKELDGDLRELNRTIEQLPGVNNAVSKHSIEKLLQQLKPMTDMIQRHKGVIPSDETLRATRANESCLREFAVAAETEVTMLNKELSALLDESTRQDYLMRNHEGLKQTLTTLREEIASWDNQQWLFPDLFVGDTITIDQLRGAQDARVWGQKLGTTLDAVHSNERLAVLEERLCRFDQVSAGLSERLQRVKNVLHGLEHERGHFLDTAEVDCPKCTHRFRPGVRKSLQTIEKEINENVVWKKQVEEELETLLANRKDVESDVGYLRQVREIVLTYSKDPVLCLFFKKLQEKDVFTDNRHQFAGIANTFGQELEQAVDCLISRRKLAKAEKDWMEAVAAVGNVDGALHQKIEHLRNRLGNATERLSERRRAVEEVSDVLTYQENVKRAVDQFNTLYSRLGSDVQTSMTNALVNELLSARESKLDAFTTARERFRQMENEMVNLDGLEKELAELQAHHFNNKLMIQAWSPEKGVLRKYFYNAIVRITELMSRYIDRVWSYPMRVMPCDLSEGDLDYTFPVQLKTHPEPVPDVRKGSKAQRAIFNLMFRLTAYKALNLQHYPLVLDEPSEGMDEEHKNSLVGFIKSIAQSGEFSQLLVVSHEAEVHSKLNEATYCVVEPEGVTLPPVYNEGVKIVYAA
ncbi:putative SMC domain-containing protein [Erwinia phage phiEaH2]|uniref:Putative SMC domain-containing protein n=1 Tax=Erwinia phage phiEaH2 TaxID=1029988 RepID=J7KKK2_9CAUD|nr:putative SMC domain-containing protein [Erwinia phage phiEaH2]AFQ96655.1 putative SMC domain-containing protein [Erwinia phage phiEaH2]